MRTLRAYLELSRVSNAPTVISNALAGSALALAASTATWSLWAVAATAIACSAFYVAGMAFNDVFDRRIDARERPARPIPSGRVRASGASIFATTLIGAGLACLTTVSIEALIAGAVLVAMILLYDLLHTLTPWAVLLMGACRAMVYVVAAIAIDPGLGAVRSATVLGPAFLLFVYVAGFSVLARREATAAIDEPQFRCGHCGYRMSDDRGTCPECGKQLGPRSAQGVRASLRTLNSLHPSALLPLLLLSAFLFLPTGRPLRPPSVPLGSRGDLAVLGMLVAAGLLLAWLTAASRAVQRRPPAIGLAVTMWIAGISLYDTYLLLLWRQPELTMSALACFIVTRLLQRRVPAT